MTQSLRRYSHVEDGRENKEYKMLERSQKIAK
jgi:hypothetical protein